MQFGPARKTTASTHAGCFAPVSPHSGRLGRGRVSLAATSFFKAPHAPQQFDLGAIPDMVAVIEGRVGGNLGEATAGFGGLAKVVMGQRQEQPILLGAAVAGGRDGPFQVLYRVFETPRPQKDAADRVEVGVFRGGVLRKTGEEEIGQDDRAAVVADGSGRDGAHPGHEIDRGEVQGIHLHPVEQRFAHFPIARLVAGFKAGDRAVVAHVQRHRGSHRNFRVGLGGFRPLPTRRGGFGAAQLV